MEGCLGAQKQFLCRRAASSYSTESRVEVKKQFLSVSEESDEQRKVLRKKIGQKAREKVNAWIFQLARACSIDLLMLSNQYSLYIPGGSIVASSV